MAYVTEDIHMLLLLINVMIIRVNKDLPYLTVTVLLIKGKLYPFSTGSMFLQQGQ